MIKHSQSICQYERINVVGNAKSLLSKNLGKEIDAYPTIRFNHINKLDPIHQGSRWDYVACSQIKLINNYGAKPEWHTLIYTNWKSKQDLGYQSTASHGNVNVIPLDQDLVNHTLSTFKKRPSTGASIMMYLDSLGVQCNIFGFDWKETPSFYQDERTEKRVNGPHDYEDERRICLSLIEKNGWTLY